MMGIAAASGGGLRHVPRSRTVAWRSAVGVGGSAGEGGVKQREGEDRGQGCMNVVIDIPIEHVSDWDLPLFFFVTPIFRILLEIFRAIQRILQRLHALKPLFFLVSVFSQYFLQIWGKNSQKCRRYTAFRALCLRPMFRPGLRIPPRETIAWCNFYYPHAIAKKNVF